MALPGFTDEETEAQEAQGPNGFAWREPGEPALGSFHTRLPSCRTRKGAEAPEAGGPNPAGLLPH